MERTDGYAPIGSYGLLGDGHGSALVASDGSVDWLACPKIDSPPFLAGVLDRAKGGSFRIEPVEEARVERRYLDGTMTLETRFVTSAGPLVVTDALNVGVQGHLPWTELVRRIEAVDEPVRFRFSLRPGDRLATVRPWVHVHDGKPFVLSGDLLGALVMDGIDDWRATPHEVSGEVELRPGAPALLALVLAQQGPVLVPRPEEVLDRLDHTNAAWRSWSAQVGYDGPHREHALRSALVLKALASSDSGALAAAPTTSLPEVIEGDRNFDYRFGWVRDSSFMLDALAGLGLVQELDASLSWLLGCVRRTAPGIDVFYRLSGAPATGEQQQVAEYEGYRRSRPVTIGNKAAKQVQHGAYGDLFGAVARHVEHGGHLDTKTAVMLAELADHVCDTWTHPGAGIWELGDDQRYTSSMIANWAALERARQLVERGEIAPTHVERWKETADEIHRFADEHCWSTSKQAYTFYAGTEDLDAAVLLAARTGFLAGDDARLWTTIDAIRTELTAEGPLLYRYTGAAKQENAFICCTFWLVEALSIAGRVEEAGPLLEAALGYGNDLHLFSEEVDPANAELLGNLPLGLSHLAVIGAILSFASAERRRR